MAERHFVDGGVDHFWGTAGNWSLTEGGAGGQTVPLETEDVFFDAGSPNCTVNSSTRKAKTLTTTAYTGTLTFGVNLQVYGNITIGAGTVLASTTSYTLEMIASGTWTTNGVTIPNNVRFGHSSLGVIVTITLADDLTVEDQIQFLAGTSTTMAGNGNLTAARALFMNHQTVTLAHDVTINGLTTVFDTNVLDGAFNWYTAGISIAASYPLSGTATVVLTGGTWSAGNSASFVGNNLTLAGDITISGSVYFKTGTLLYSSGTITIGTSVLSIGGSCTLDVAALTWYRINITVNGTITLASALNISGVLAISSATLTFSGAYAISAGTCTISGGTNITLAADVTIAGLTTVSSTDATISGAYHWHTGGLTLSRVLSGSTTIVLTGGTLTTTFQFYNKVIFDGDVTFSGTILSYSPLITWVSGAISVGTTIWSQRASTTFDTAGMSFANLTITVASTITINSLLTVTGTLTLPDFAVTFAGTAGWTVGTLGFAAVTYSRTYTFKEGITYTILTSFTFVSPTSSAASRGTFTSAHATTRAIITLAYGASQTVAHLNATRIDSSLGQAIFSAEGTITNSYNWAIAHQSGNVSYVPGGESVTVSGITKDNAGDPLGSCDVYLFRDNGDDSPTYIAYVESDPTTGAYSFTVFPGSSYFCVGFKSGATPKMDATDRTLVAV